METPDIPATYPAIKLCFQEGDDDVCDTDGNATPEESIDLDVGALLSSCDRKFVMEKDM
jgi:hypothetical protein